ncbi:SusD/RagB family nutrient-binding outer membrane lipoprotein [Aquiflexum sp. LQ15W]|uniref:SusD/RagB family nutrient-binding outer membrane lipoprotein n=1 Tax=Cognataquiflexum nitidum TaxID=2922272 RepID=UPI001F13E392|nr:SusD/RagB family nutrient-binding outer membrane lipoprotein [Cognataquiflexum nitidum]MCH6200057.1 SusD/RagB family nutrient-binding outer membrane lipoprotein [Cognataquiflexum nitidum]
MKKIFNFILLVLMLGYSTSCDQNFDELNTNRVAATSIDPAFQLNNATINSSPNSFGMLVYEMGIVQQIISPNSGVLTGANFNQDNRASTQDNWQKYYRNVIKNTKDIISRIEDDPTRSNLLQMTRIIQAYGFMVLTDSYGSIPYAEAGAGFSDQVFYPKYDTQESIYTDLIKELEEASAALNTSGRVETADILYAGNIAKWKKFGYSLLLRAGMRLSNANPTLAQQTVAKAFAGGVIISNSDNAVIVHDANYVNPAGNTLNATEAANFYMTEPFVNFLKSTNDPRLRAIAVRYVGAKSGSEQQPARQTFDPSLQIGMPMGNDNAGAVQVAANLGLASFYDFSQVDRRRVAKITAPGFMVTASQTNLLLAEARQRGWVTTGTAAEYFEAGVRAHMAQMALHDAASTIPDADIDAYITANPLTEATALQQINSQYWVSSLMNGPEAFANFRRSGFPALTANPFPGREVLFINRLTYPNSEISVNSENVNAAIAAQGTDDLETKVWWDK